MVHRLYTEFQAVDVFNSEQGARFERSGRVNRNRFNGSGKIIKDYIIILQYIVD